MATTNVIYAGEYVRLTTGATFRDTPLTEADITSARITIWRLAGGDDENEEVRSETAMEWDDELQEWFFDFDIPVKTTDRKYLWRAKLVGPGAHENFEFNQFTAKKTKEPAIP